MHLSMYLCFFFNDTATTEIYTLSLHDALPIFHGGLELQDLPAGVHGDLLAQVALRDGRGDLGDVAHLVGQVARHGVEDRKSTRLNSSHANISYAVFCLKKKKISKSIRTCSSLT